MAGRDTGTNLKGAIMQTCKQCSKTLPLESFYKSTRCTSGYRGVCIKCCADNAAERYEKTKEFVGNNQKNLPMPSREWLRSNFDYHNDGYLIRKTARGRQKAGSIVARKLEGNGYYRMNINYSAYLVHRIIWKWHHGTEPDFIDHVNNIRTDCRIENLQDAVTKNFNAQKQLKPTCNKSGFIGVSKYIKGGWVAKICVDRKNVHIGYFSDPVSAAKAYNKKTLELHGEAGAFKVAQNLKAITEYESK